MGRTRPFKPPPSNGCRQERCVVGLRLANRATALGDRGQDIDGFSIRTTSGHRLSGQVTVEGATLTPAIARRLRLSVIDSRAGLGMMAVMSSASTGVQSDGSFEVRGMSGTRVVRVAGLPEGWRLKAVRASAEDVTDEGVEVRGDVRDLQVVLTATSTRVSGRVVEGRGEPVAGAAIIVFPQDRSRWTVPDNRYVTSMLAGSDGTFQATGLPPAEYRIIALPELADGEWAQPGYLDQLLPRATPFAVTEGTAASLTVRLQSSK